jgi:hypothetical protein
MINTYNLKTVKANYETISYFYKREKSDACGNSRFRVYILDSDAPAVYETIFKCQEFQIAQHVSVFVENAAMED